MYGEILPSVLVATVRGSSTLQRRSRQPVTDAGFAKIAGIELVLLDTVRYFHRAAGLNGTAKIVLSLRNALDDSGHSRAMTIRSWNADRRRLRPT